MKPTSKEQLAQNLLQIFMSFVKSGTSCRSKYNLEEHINQSGFTGIFTGLGCYYSKEELHDILFDMWDDFY